METKVQRRGPTLTPPFVFQASVRLARPGWFCSGPRGSDRRTRQWEEGRAPPKRRPHHGPSNRNPTSSFPVSSLRFLPPSPAVSPPTRLPLPSQGGACSVPPHRHRTGSAQLQQRRRHAGSEQSRPGLAAVLAGLLAGPGSHRLRHPAQHGGQPGDRRRHAAVTGATRL